MRQVLVLLSILFTIAPQSFSQASLTQAKRSSTPRSHALELLRQSESDVQGFPPAMRAHLRFQLAEAYSRIDKNRSVQNLIKGFYASQAIEEDPKIKAQLQGWILGAMLEKDVKTFDNILAKADPVVRDNVVAYQLRRSITLKEFDKALALLERSDGTFPYLQATELIERLPPERSGDRTRVVQLGLQAADHEPNLAMAISSFGLPRMIGRCWTYLPREVVLNAIDETLELAKVQDEQTEKQPMTIGSAQGSVSFTSQREAAFFQLLPALRQLDEGRANSLLQQFPQLVPKMERYAEGGQSLEKGSGELEKGTPFSVTLRAPGGAVGMADDRTSYDLMSRAEQIVRESSSNPRQALAATTTLPATLPDGTSPKLQALLGVARSCLRTEKSVAEEALRELVKTAREGTTVARLKYMGEAVALYRELDNKAAALDAINEGVKLADTLYEKDTNLKDPNRALKAYWPSAVAWREFTVLAATISPRRAEEIAWEIPDEELRANSLIALANAMLGGKAASAIIADERESGTKLGSSFELPAKID